MKKCEPPIEGRPPSPPPSSDSTRPADKSAPSSDEAPHTDNNPMSANDSPLPLIDSPPPSYYSLLPSDDNPPQIHDGSPLPHPVNESLLPQPAVNDSKLTKVSINNNLSLPSTAETLSLTHSIRSSRPKRDVITSSTNNQLPFSITTKAPLKRLTRDIGGPLRQKGLVPGPIGLTW